jgi:hypothetical protein
MERAARDTPPRPATAAPSAEVDRAPKPKPGKPVTEPAAAPERVVPPEPDWLRPLQAGDRRRARELIARLDALGIIDGAAVVKAEVVDREPALARLALERRLGAVAASAGDTDEAARAVIQVILDGEDTELGATWRLVDGHGRRIEGLDPDPRGRHRSDGGGAG